MMPLNVYPRPAARSTEWCRPVFFYNFLKGPEKTNSFYDCHLYVWGGWVSDPTRHGFSCDHNLSGRAIMLWLSAAPAKARQCFGPASLGAAVDSAAPDHRIASHRGISRLTRLDGQPPWLCSRPLLSFHLPLRCRRWICCACTASTSSLRTWRSARPSPSPVRTSLRQTQSYSQTATQHHRTSSPSTQTSIPCKLTSA
jgi:hypothetical protein